MIIRALEYCPRCGQVMPWRKETSRIIKGVRTLYVKCRRCGKRDKIEYRGPDQYDHRED